MRSRRRYVVYGSGAVGGALGGRLLLTGARVVLIARGAQLAALRARGLTLRSAIRSDELAPTTVEGPEAIHFEEGDVVLLCVKSQHTKIAIDALRACAPRSVPIVCAQNGVANERLAKDAFERVYGLLLFAPLTFLAPGEVLIHSEPVLGGIDLGCHPSGVDALAREIADDLVRAGFDARAVPDIERLKYGKLLGNLGNVLQALGGRAALDSALSQRVEAEALTCYRAAGIEFASTEEILARHANVCDLPVLGSPRGGGSTWQSLARKTGTIETEALNGEIVRLGETHAIPTPLNRALVALALRAASEGWSPGCMSVAELEGRLAELDRAVG